MGNYISGYQSEEDDSNQPIFFWKHDQENGYLANWFLSQFEDDDGRKFQHLESYINWRKAVFFNNQEMAEKISEETDPRRCKRFGQQLKIRLTMEDKQRWSEYKFQVMVDGNLLKFSQDPVLKDMLLKTGDRLLIKASPNDKIDGVGLSQENPDILDPSKWQGQNLSGKALMGVRDIIREEQNEPTA